MKRKVLFLCTGNSSRSQMAEAIVNARLGDQWQAVSAGTKPTGYVHPKALAALVEIGIQHESRSKLVDEFRGVDFDLVVTVCDSAAEECPVWLGKGKKVHHSFPDPAKTDDMEVFRRMRDDIGREIVALLKTETGDICMEIDLLYFNSCPSWQAGLENLKAALALVGLDANIRLVEVKDNAEADRLRFLGSPSFHVNGADLWPEERASYALSCRVYATPQGMRGAPSAEMLQEKLHPFVIH